MGWTVLLVVVAPTVSAYAAPRSAGAAPLLRLVAPPDGECYFGFTFRLWDTSEPGWGDTRPFGERVADSVKNELGGKRPTWLTVWATWQRPDNPGKPMVPFSAAEGDIQSVQGVTGPKGVLYLDWNLTLTTAQNGGITVKDIATGAVDSYIKEYARQIKAYGKPVLVRLFGGEFNGNWWYGQSPWASPNLSAADFVAAWRHVVDIFRNEGALNAAWAWIPVAALASSSDPNVAPYYPGDDYVDWMGADTSDLAGPQVLDPLYGFALAHGKPFFLAEFGLRAGGSVLTPRQQRDWLNGMFDYFESHPDIKAINYFDYNSRSDSGYPLDPARLVYLDRGQVSYQANTNDYDQRLIADSSADFRGTYAGRISASRYLSSILTAPVAVPSATATLLPPIVSGHIVTISWQGNDTAQTYDVAISRKTNAWRTVLSRATFTSYRLRGTAGERLRIRVRGRDDIDQPGSWSPTIRIVFK